MLGRSNFRFDVYNVCSSWKDNIGSAIYTEDFPITMWGAFTNRFKNVDSLGLGEAAQRFPKDGILSGPKFDLSHNRYRWGMSGILDLQSNVDRKVTFVVDQGPLNLRNDLKPRPLFVPHFSKLTICGIGLPLGLIGQVSQIGDGGFDISGIGDRVPCQDRNEQGANANEKSQPFVDGKTAEEIAGWTLVAFASLVGAIGAACLMAAQCGGDLDLSVGQSGATGFLAA
jgi:hypothetical protein